VAGFPLSPPSIVLAPLKLMVSWTAEVPVSAGLLQSRCPLVLWAPQVPSMKNPFAQRAIRRFASLDRLVARPPAPVTSEPMAAAPRLHMSEEYPISE
jgi:hypothetical protein